MKHILKIIGMGFVLFSSNAIAEDIKFDWPIDCIPGQTCGYIGYADIDKDSTPWDCSDNTYLDHHGTDISAPKGTTVKAAQKGTVYRVFHNPDRYDDCEYEEFNDDMHPDCKDAVPKYSSNGNTVCLDDGYCFAGGNIIILKHQFQRKTYWTIYEHLKSGSVLVKEGDTVQIGQKIAEVASSGQSTEYHLHFEVWNKYERPIDPFWGDCSNEIDNSEKHHLWNVNSNITPFINSIKGIPVSNPIPNKPTNISVDGITTSQFTLHFKDNSTNEKGYKVYINGAYNRTITHATSGTGNQYWYIGGLKADTNYNVKVYAYNDSGWSPVSETKYFKTLSLKPKQVTNLWVDGITTSQFTLHFKDNSTNEKGYKVYINGVYNRTITYATSGTGYQYWYIGGLKADTNYNVKVYAYNDYGWSPVSATKYFKTAKPVNVKPNAVSNVWVDGITGGQFTLHFKDNSTNELGYKIYIDGVYNRTISYATSGTGYQYWYIGGLSRWASHRVQVYAYNNYGWSAVSPSVYFNTK